MRWILAFFTLAAVAKPLDYLEVYGAMSNYSPVPGSGLYDQGHSYLYLSGFDDSQANGVIELDYHRKIPDEEVLRMIDLFYQNSLSFTWWSGSENLKKWGFEHSGEKLGMALDVSKYINNAKKHSKVRIRKVVKPVEVRACDAFIFGSSEPLDQESQDLLKKINDGLMQERFIAISKGRVIGAIAICFGTSVPGIWDLKVDSSSRKQGVGTALVHAAIVEAQKRGVNKVLALLEVDRLSYGIFKKCGFEEECRLPFYTYCLEGEEAV